MTYSKGTGSPRRTTPRSTEVHHRSEYGRITQRNVDDAVVCEGAHHRDARRLLAAAQGRGGHEQARVLAPETAGLPLVASLVPEGLPLRRHVAVTGRHAEEEGVVGLERLGVAEDFDVAGLRWGVHLAEDFVGEGFFDSGRVG